MSPRVPKTEVTRLLYQTTNKALTFLAGLDSRVLGGLVGHARSVTRGPPKIRQDTVNSHHLSFNQGTDGG